ncbi:MAG: hypothetical protein AAF202_13285, partial [Pseudomonadota bacterium]
PHLANEKMQDRNPYEIPENPFLNRNLNYLYHFFKLRARLRLHGDAVLLSASGNYNKHDVVSIVDRYFRYGQTGRLGERSGYSFHWVLQMVNRFLLIQGELGLPLSEQPIVIFGSFPSGLANIYRSDIDITVPQELEAIYKRSERRIEQRLYEQMPIHPSHQPQSISDQIWSLLGYGTDLQTARKGLELNYYAPADDYRDIDPNVTATNTEVLSFLNPINIKIFSDRVEIVITDSMAYDKPIAATTLTLPIEDFLNDSTTPASDFNLHTAPVRVEEILEPRPSFPQTSQAFRDGARVLPAFSKPARREQLPEALPIANLNFMQATASSVFADLETSLSESIERLSTAQEPLIIEVWQDQSGRIWTADHR